MFQQEWPVVSYSLAHFIWWNFVASTKALIKDVKARWQAQWLAPAVVGTSIRRNRIYTAAGALKPAANRV